MGIGIIESIDGGGEGIKDLGLEKEDRGRERRHIPVAIEANSRSSTVKEKGIVTELNLEED